MNMKDIEVFDISIEEFDQMNEKHIFSDKYKRKKKELLKDYRKKMYVSKKESIMKTAIACALVVVASPMIVNAASNGEVFERIWGTFSRSSIESHDETVYSEDKGKYYTETYPEREYVDVEEEKAEELIGSQMEYPEIERKINDTTLTILSAVRDHNSAVVEFTLEKEGGVDALGYSQFDNEAKGAYFSDDSTFWFRIGDGGENIFVDLKKSTDEKIYCYDYMTLESSANYISMDIYEYPCTRGEYFADSEAYYDQIKMSTVQIPVSKQVPFVEYTNDDEGHIELSPISIQIDMRQGLGLTKDETHDSWSCYFVAINYKDGTSYVVREHEKAGKHTCDVEIDNSSYGYSSLDDKLTYVFNRLVDVNEIASITVNDREYTCK